MAVRPQHMHDGGIVERRLRPIYGNSYLQVATYLNIMIFEFKKKTE